MTEIVISYRYVFPVVAGALVENHLHLIVPKEVYVEGDMEEDVVD